MFARTDVPSGLAVDKSAGRLLSAVAASTYGRYEVSLMLVVKDIVLTHPNELLKIVGLLYSAGSHLRRSPILFGGSSAH